MNKLLQFFLGTILFVFILDFGLATILDSLYTRNKAGESGGLVNFFLDHKEEFDLLIVGSSRAHRHVIPEEFGCKAFNLSHHGLRIPFTAGLLDVLNDESKIPKVLLVHLELNSFSYYYEQNEVKDEELRNLNFFYKKNDFVTDIIDNISFGEWIKYLFHSYRHNGKLPSLFKNYIKTSDIKETYDGFDGLPVNLTDTIRLNKQQKLHNNILKQKLEIPLQLSQRAINYLDHVIKVAESANTQLIFFSSPKLFKNFEGENKASDFLENYLEKKGVVYINYTQQPLGVLDNKRYWRDFEHMNIDGAKIFTTMFKKDLKEQIDRDCFN